MNLQFSTPTNHQAYKFLPRQLADSTPFSSNKLPEIYSEFSVNPGSDEAAAMKKTIQECEDAGIRGEEKLCATSLESMVDFTTSKLGRDAVALSTEADTAERKLYRIEAVTPKKSAVVVVCHQQEYAYAVFYCHKTDTTAAYEVSLVGSGGAKAEAVAVCHRDTAEWNPKHLAFEVLKVKPGTAPVCHYLPQNHIVWVSKN
ncbi:BURP domain-containing protein [Perilla frutescens var. hirtella]|nr:BURP domain-containing protein [Perilla frutescens var. hirtella]